MAKPCSLRFPITLRIRWGKAGQSALSPLTCFATSLKHVALKLGHLQARLSNFWNLANADLIKKQPSVEEEFPTTPHGTTRSPSSKAH